MQKFRIAIFRGGMGFIVCIFLQLHCSNVLSCSWYLVKVDMNIGFLKWFCNPSIIMGPACSLQNSSGRPPYRSKTADVIPVSLTHRHVEVPKGELTIVFNKKNSHPALYRLHSCP